MSRSRKPSPVTGLIGLEVRFVDEYLKDFNGSAAAIRAGYSPNGAKERACTLLKRPRVRAEVERRRTKVEEKVGITVERVLEEFARVAFSDARALYDEHGNMRSLQDLTPEVAATLAGMETEELYSGTGEDRQCIGITRKVKRWDKVRALENLAKIKGMYREPQGELADFAARLVRARERVKAARK